MSPSWTSRTVVRSASRISSALGVSASSRRHVSRRLDSTSVSLTTRSLSTVLLTVRLRRAAAAVARGSAPLLGLARAFGRRPVAAGAARPLARAAARCALRGQRGGCRRSSAVGLGQRGRRRLAVRAAGPASAPASCPAHRRRGGASFGGMRMEPVDVELLGHRPGVAGEPVQQHTEREEQAGAQRADRDERRASAAAPSRRCPRARSSCPRRTRSWVISVAAALMTTRMTMTTRVVLDVAAQRRGSAPSCRSAGRPAARRTARPSPH